MTALAASRIRLGGTVVLVQHDDSGVGEGALELEDVPHVGPPPTVDGLVRVPHHGHLVMATGQLQDELVLRPVSVLVLVDQNVQKALPVGFEYLGVRPEKLDRQQQKVVKIHGVGRHQTPLVLLVDIGDLALENRAAASTLGVGGRAQELVLGPGNSGVHGSRREFL